MVFLRAGGAAIRRALRRIDYERLGKWFTKNA